MRRVQVFCLVLALLAGCSSIPPLPLADLRGPVAVKAVPSGGENDTVVFLANADEEELRAFIPETGLFVRGPNAISPLSILLGFRPQRLAGGALDTEDGTVGFVLVAGGANRVALVDAQQYRVREDAAELERCDQGLDSALCLPGAVVDVAVSGSTGYALVSGNGASPQLAVLEVVSEDGVPFARLVDLLPLSGEPVALTVDAEGSRAFVADAGSPRIFEVSLPGGATRELSVDAPAVRLVSTPAYVREDGAPEPSGRYLLAILQDGRLQTIDPSAGGPAADPIDPSRPIAPLSFATPMRDFTFIPCPETNGPCRTRLRAAGEVRELPLVGFAALGDGTVAAVVPDAADPQVFRPWEAQPGQPQAGTVSFSEPERLPGTSAADVRLNVDAQSLTRGVTRTETIRVTYNGTIPGFAVRPGRLERDGGSTVLTDPRGGLADPDRAREGDRVRVTGLEDTCFELEAPVEFEVAAVDDARLTLTPMDGALPEECFPSRVVFDLVAAADDPWVVRGSATGYAGRTRLGESFLIAPDRFAYVPDAVPGPAVAFSLEGNDPTPNAEFSFTTTSGVNPFLLGPFAPSQGRSFPGLANGVTATSTRLYTAVVGNQALVEAVLAELGQANSVRTYDRSLRRR